MTDSHAVRAMFARIAHRYDAANRLLSAGLDLTWRHRLVRAVKRCHPRQVLDLATGSGDVAFALSRGLGPHVEILGMDFCPPMLERAAAKKSDAGPAAYRNVTFQPGDGLDLPLPDASFDAVTIAFGLRNLADRARGLNEMRRVLRSGGHLYVLEFSQPQPWFRPLYNFYLQQVLPRVAGWLTGDQPAYAYLNESIGRFPDHEALATEIAAAGFHSVQARRLTFGIVALHEATAAGRV